MIQTLAFYFFSAVCLALFGISIFSKNVLYALSALAGGMVFMSGFFFLLDAEFLGVVQIIVYTGAVIVLYGFALVFLGADKNVSEPKKGARLFFALSGVIAFLLVIIVLGAVVANNVETLKILNTDDTEALGMIIFTKYLAIFELAAVMLLVAMICAIVLAHKQMDASLSYEESEG